MDLHAWVGHERVDKKSVGCWKAWRTCVLKSFSFKNHPETLTACYPETWLEPQICQCTFLWWLIAYLSCSRVVVEDYNAFASYKLAHVPWHAMYVFMQPTFSLFILFPSPSLTTHFLLCKTCVIVHTSAGLCDIFISAACLPWINTINQIYLYLA